MLPQCPPAPAPAATTQPAVAPEEATRASSNRTRSENIDAACELLAISLDDSLRRLAQQEHRVTLLLREFDLHRVYRRHGASSSAAWLRKSCGVSSAATRERLRAAYSLLNLPRIDDAFAAGELSYAKVIALSRLAASEDAASRDEDKLLAAAATMDESQLQRCRVCPEPDTPGRRGRRARRARRRLKIDHASRIEYRYTR